MLKTSFFRRLTGSLCDAVLDTDHSANVLEQLERDNLFLVQLERGGDRVWYRYNPLFAESLQYLAKQRLDEAHIRTLFEKASDWYAYHGLFDEAIDTSLTARLFERAMTLIEKFIEIHDMSELRTLGRWLEDIPQQEILRHPAICFTYAQVILYSTDRFAPATAARIEPFLRAGRVCLAEETGRLNDSVKYSPSAEMLPGGRAIFKSPLRTHANPWISFLNMTCSGVGIAC